MTLKANGAYGRVSSGKTSETETEMCADSAQAPAVEEGQHVYEHIGDVVKGTMPVVETHLNQAYESINIDIGKE
jgi:hypothetical protein